MSAKPKLRLGLIGTGFMGKTHVFGFAMALKSSTCLSTLSCALLPV
jgi:hypothetical protein